MGGLKLRAKEVKIELLPLIFPGCVTLSKSPDLSEPPFSHGNNNNHVFCLAQFCYTGQMRDGNGFVNRETLHTSLINQGHECVRGSGGGGDF